MKRRYEAKAITSDTVEPAHSIEIVCAACGFDLDEAEFHADRCSDCGASLNLKKSVTIEVTSVPAQGDTSE
tara:strand:- start:530 stop:742 length:213 start_codon:yes stop_codon:yes gene_type:complete